MSRVLILVVLSLSGVIWAEPVAEAQECGGGGGSLSDLGINVHADDSSCRGEGGEVGAQYRFVRFVRPEPSVCAGTPDGLQETIRIYDIDTNGLIQEIVRCIDPNVPSPALPPAPPSALDVFRSAPLPLPEVHLSPRVRGLVGLETYLWWGADTAVPPLTVTAGEWSASIEVRATRISWDLGNGDVVTSDSAGSPGQPAVTYVYTEQCDCTVTLTVEWSGVVTLTHPLAPAPIVQPVGPVAFTDTFPYVVEEREAVIVG